MGRAEHILHENAAIIDNMMQQMDDFAAANGGYINRSGVGNFRTPSKDDKDEGALKKAAAGLGAAALGAGATYAAQNTATGRAITQAVKPHLATAKKAAGAYIAKKTGATVT